jgi:hypothetical protein
MSNLHIKSSQSNDFWGYFGILAYNIVMLFYEKINAMIIIALGIMFFFWFLYKYGGKWNFFQLLSFLVCIYVPTSFVSIIGTDYGAVPVTWFNLITIVLFILILFKRIKINYFFFSPLIMLIFGLLTITKSYDVIDSSKQLLTIILFLISFFIGEFLSQYSSKDYNIKLKSFYFISVISYSIVIVIQKLCSLLNVKVGYQDVIGSGRVVFAGLMNDYSFATLYVATGAIILVIDYIDRKKIGLLKFIILESFLLCTILIINSRTGLAAFAVTVALYLIVKIARGNLKGILLLILLAIPIPSILAYIVENRGGQSFFEGSGRVELIYAAIQIFVQHPFIGVGFGLNNLYIITGIRVPHNLIAQYLAQFGVIGAGIFFSNFVVLCFKYLRFQSKYFWVLLTILLGSMLIPDIVSSRFLSVIVIMTIIASVKKNTPEI